MVVGKMISAFYRFGDKWRDALASCFVASIAIGLIGQFAPLVSVPILASIGASAFMVCVVHHSPMAQPWPVIGGHLVAASVGLLCVQWLPNPVLAMMVGMGVSILLMNALHCLHPPSGGTLLIAILGGADVHNLGWNWVYEVVAVNAVAMVLLGLVLNNMIFGRVYPLNARSVIHKPKLGPKLNVDNFAWALTQMKGLIDVDPEDLVEIYEFAIEHAGSEKD